MRAFINLCDFRYFEYFKILRMKLVRDASCSNEKWRVIFETVPANFSPRVPGRHKKKGKDTMQSWGTPTN